MQKIVSLAAVASLALGLALPAFAQSASAPGTDTKMQTDVKMPDQAKDKAEAKKPQQVAQHPGTGKDSGNSNTGSDVSK